MPEKTVPEVWPLPFTYFYAYKASWSFLKNENQ